MSAVYLYAVVGGAPAGPLGLGLFGEPIAIARSADLLVAVGAGRDPPIDEASLRGHDRAVRRIAACCDAVLPARFGTLTDGKSLARILARERDLLRASLARVAGRTQMTVRLHAAPLASTPSPPLGGPGSRYLAARRPSLPALTALRRTVGGWVKAERVEWHGARDLAATVHHLVDRAAAADYRAAVAAEPELAGARLAANAPWPPYAFAGWSAP